MNTPSPPPGTNNVSIRAGVLPSSAVTVRVMRLALLAAHHITRSQGELKMPFGRSSTSTITAVAVITAGSLLSAQSPVVPSQTVASARGASLIVPVTGVADLGGMFSGALLIERFSAQGNGIVASGLITGALVVNGTFRNLVIPTTLPLDVANSRARIATDAALAQAPCGVLHMELGGSTMSVLGSTIAVNPVAFDVVSPAATTAATSTSTTSTSGGQSGTVTPLSSANATQASAGSATPGAAVPTAGTTTSAPVQATSSPLGTLLCSVNGFKDAGNAAQLAQQLNGVLAALATP
jgi:hypothetical protein